MKIKKIKIHGGGTKKIKIRDKITPGKVAKTGATAYSGYKKYQKFQEDAKKKGTCMVSGVPAICKAPLAWPFSVKIRASPAKNPACILISSMNGVIDCCGN